MKKVPVQRIEIRLDQPKQALMDKLVETGQATWLGYGGSKGGSKSYTCRNIMLRRRFSHPGTVGTIFRRIYRDVKDNHIDPLLLQYPYMRPWYRVQDEELRIPNGSVLRFRHLETRADVEAQGGNETMDALVDEAQQFTEEELAMLKGNVRWPNLVNTKARMLLTFNPGGMGGPFLKRVFYDRKFREHEQPEDFRFVQAFGWDNVAWAKEALQKIGKTSNDYYKWTDEERFKFFVGETAYGRDLNSKPHALRIQWLLGDMTAFVGQYFDNWQEDVHVRPVRPDSWIDRSVGIDWGMGHEAATYWGAEHKPKQFGVYREKCVAGLSPRALAQFIVDATPELERKLVKRIGLSHECFSKTEGPVTRAAQMASVFAENGMPYPYYAGKDKIGAASLIYDMLSHDEGKEPGLVIDPSCQKLINVIPLISRDPEDRESTIKFEGDDPFDGLKHLIHYMIKAGPKPHADRVREEAAGITDPLRRWQYITKRLQEKKSNSITPDYNRPVWMGEQR